MDKNIDIKSENEFVVLCRTVREFMEQRKYRECRQLITNAMGNYPHAPHPHNLLGILLENEGDHLLAMKHFRAAWALDPTYIPARYNLNRYGSLFATGNSAYDETDCSSKQEKELYKIEYDEHGVGHVVRRNVHGNF
ncbi:MAG: two component, sigma-54 specific, transcriptional regulator, Fis family [Herbinix sp.]|jgi:tetratricopeptide (TPR) repeat protein|nr:two component, sigma-54 specific, transcriptional regulator, Fis family [Herbinix sp.]